MISYSEEFPDSKAKAWLNYRLKVGEAEKLNHSSIMYGGRQGVRLNEQDILKALETFTQVSECEYQNF